LSKIINPLKLEESQFGLTKNINALLLNDNKIEISKILQNFDKLTRCSGFAGIKIGADCFDDKV